MPETIENLLKKAQQLEKQNDYKQLAVVYKQIATYYHKKKDKVKNEEFLAKSREAKEKIPEKEIKINISAEEEFEQIMQIADNEEKFRKLEKFADRHEKKVPRVYFEIGVIAYRINLYEKAKNYFEKCLNINDKNDKINNSLIYNYLGNIYREFFGEYELAKVNYEIAIKLNPKSAGVYNNLANLLRNNYFREYDLALNYFHKSIELDSKFAAAYNNLALLFQHDYFKEYQLAKKNYEIAINLSPKFAEAYSNYANLLSNEYFKEYEFARKNYEKALSLNPKLINGYNGLANLLKNGHFREFQLSKIYYEKGLEFGKNVDYLHFNYALLIANYLNDKEQAMYHFKRAIELKKNEEITKESREKLKELAFEGNKPAYISKIKVDKILHLKDIEIDVDSSERKHLLITGHNGCGKTVLMNHLRNHLQKIIDCGAEVAIMNDFEKDLDTDNPNLMTITPTFRGLYYKYHTGFFVIAHFHARRDLRFSNIEGNFEFPEYFPIIKDDTSYYANGKFLDFVAMKYKQLAIAENENNALKIKQLNRWTEQFENILKEIDPRIEKLIFTENPYKISLIPKKPYLEFTFNQLADGFASIFSIVAELMLRMHNKAYHGYDLEGLVLLDEPEAHLHLETQKQILPKLTKIFPNVQFIVATHSPFILSSLPNAVVFDMEKLEKVEDLSKYAVDNIIETYFETDRYSKDLMDKLMKYKELSKKQNLSDSETRLLNQLIDYFTINYDAFSMEVQIELKQLKLSKLGK